MNEWLFVLHIFSPFDFLFGELYMRIGRDRDRDRIFVAWKFIGYGHVRFLDSLSLPWKTRKVKTNQNFARHTNTRNIYHSFFSYQMIFIRDNERVCLNVVVMFRTQLKKEKRKCAYKSYRRTTKMMMKMIINVKKCCWKQIFFFFFLLLFVHFIRLFIRVCISVLVLFGLSFFYDMTLQIA